MVWIGIIIFYLRGYARARILAWIHIFILPPYTPEKNHLDNAGIEPGSLDQPVSTLSITPISLGQKHHWYKKPKVTDLNFSWAWSWIWKCWWRCRRTLCWSLWSWAAAIASKASQILTAMKRWCIKRQRGSGFYSNYPQFLQYIIFLSAHLGTLPIWVSILAML